LEKEEEIVDFLAVYSEAGMIGVVGAMFIYMVYSMNRRGNEQAEALQNLKIENKGQSENIQNIESILLKLLDRWNKSDETRDRRHEKLVEEVNDLSDILMEVKGNLSRINGKH
jgi:predicted  nucleic acid-binding Zn-ribbon protein